MLLHNGKDIERIDQGSHECRDTSKLESKSNLIQQSNKVTSIQKINKIKIKVSFKKSSISIFQKE